MAEQTPIMKQYTGIKEQYPDAILLFRLGDFYEMFGTDAEVASRILQITLTSRDKNKEDPLPMCGIPHFSAENYIAKLIRAGYKVAVCEQVGDPRETKGIVHREVVRVITPGTHTPESPKENNYIAAIKPSGGTVGYALADVSTGEFVVYESDRPLEDELSRYRPSEVVVPASTLDDLNFAEVLGEYYVSEYDDWKFEYTDAYKTMLRRFRVTSLEGFGVEGLEGAVSAGGALLEYLKDSHHDHTVFRSVSTVASAAYMFLDAPTMRNLELVQNLKDGSVEGSLLWALDRTLTPMGGRFLRRNLLRPLIEVDEIQARLLAVKYLVEDFELVENVRHRLRGVLDVERLGQRIATGSANAREMVALKTSMEALPHLVGHLDATLDDRLRDLAGGIGDFRALVELIGHGIVDHPPMSTRDGGMIRKGYHAEVDELRALSTGAKDTITAMEAEERAKTGISSLKITYNRIHGYFIEITKSNLDLVPEHYERRQTLVGSERFVTPELKDYESRVLGAEEKLKGLELEVFKGIVTEAARFIPALSELAGSLAEIDYLLSMAVIAKRNQYVMPRVSDGYEINVTGGRHPVLERLPAGEKFIPNDTLLDDEGHRVLLITGPNMAGKSTYMRQVALITLMAQMGGFVPAERAEIGVVDRIFTRIGASDYLTRGQSTFMVEMVETANILNNATDRSLIVLDEVGRGTSTFDGISIAWATAEHIATEIRARTLFATHYNELTDLARKLDGIRNYNVVVKEWGDEIVFLHRIEPGPADKSYGIQVARLAGLPQIVLKKAREVLRDLERQHLGTAVGAYRQLDLFQGMQDVILTEFLALDPDTLSAEELAEEVRRLRRKAQAG